MRAAGADVLLVGIDMKMELEDAACASTVSSDTNKSSSSSSSPPPPLADGAGRRWAYSASTGSISCGALTLSIAGQCYREHIL